ncbi:MAG: hypothetical protein R3B68_09290 [Phycisphaerales bacterium]
MAPEAIHSQAVEPVETWRTQSKSLAQVLRFSLDRSFLDVLPDDLAKHLHHAPRTEGLLPTSWLRLDCVGQAEPAGSLDTWRGMRVALSTCHRPARARLYYLIQGQGSRRSIHVGLRGLGVSADSEALSRAMRGFVETARPGTRMTLLEDSAAFDDRLRSRLDARGRRFALTGVPAPQAADERPACGIEGLLSGTAGKDFTILAIADPIGPAQREELLGRVRDLIGAVHAFQRLSVSHTLTSSTTSGYSEATSESHSRSEQIGRTDSHHRHSTLHKLIDLVTVGSVALTPLVPAASMVAALSYIAGQVLPRDLTRAESHSTTSSQGRTTTRTESTSRSESSSIAVSREYVSAHLRAVLAQLERLEARFQSGELWEVGLYVAAGEDDDALDVSSQLAATLNGRRHGGEEPIRAVDLRPYWRGGVRDDLVAGRRPLFEMRGADGRTAEHPLGAGFQGLSTPLNTEELAQICAFPAREVQGVRVRPFADFASNATECTGPSIDLGSLLLGDEPTGQRVRVELGSLTKNVLVTGTVGSGKTNTVKGVLTQARSHGVPFLVIEPAKTEYLEWALDVNASLPADSPERVAIYAPGSTITGPDVHPLRLNPFFALHPDLLPSHIERLKTLLVGALPMQEGLPMLLESVLLALYRDKGWFGEGDPGAAHRWPTVSGALLTKARTLGRVAATGSESHPHADSLLAAVVLEKGYDPRVSHSFIGALRTRLAFLSEPGTWKERVLDVPESTAAADLFGRPAVVNLSDLHADRPFVAGLLLSYLHEFRRLHRVTSGLGHLAVLEEAHCLLEPARHVSADAMDPKGMLSAMVAEMLSEMRAWGQGFVIVDQFPTRLVADAIKNTNLKIVHKLPARDDQEIMAATMALSDSQRRIIPFLRPGQAVVAADHEDAALRIQVALEQGRQP